jgi:hypothetical protein
MTCPHCGQPGHYVNGHYECPVVRGFVFDGCCSGEVAEASYAEHKRFWMDEVIREASVEMNQTRHCEVADGLPGGAGNDFAYSDRNYPDVQNDRAVIGNDVVHAAFEPETGSDHRFYANNGDRAVTSCTRPCPCSGLLDLAYCGICGTANICESEPDVDDLVKAA